MSDSDPFNGAGWQEAHPVHDLGGHEPQLHPMLAAVRQVVPGLAAVLGSESEVVLHDFNYLPNSIVAIAGDLTGRKTGDAATNYLLKHLHEDDTRNVVNYCTTMPDGRVFRSSTLFLKDDSDRAVGCLCINVEISRYIEMRDYISKNLVGDDGEHGPESEGGSEVFPRDVEQLRKEMLKEAIKKVGVQVSYMKKEDKVQVVKTLEENGFFLIRGSAETAAQVLDVTRYTIYNYKDQVRASNELAE